MSETTEREFKGKITLEFDAKDIQRYIDALAAASGTTTQYRKELESLEKAFAGAGQAATKTAGDVHKLLAAYSQRQSSLQGMMRFAGDQAAMETRFHNAVAKANAERMRQQEQLNRAHASAIKENAQREVAAQKQIQQAAYDTYASNIRFSQQQEKMLSELPRARYALYDVARTYSMISVAALGAATAVGATGVAFQRDFAQVERTTGVTGAAVGKLRRDLEDLTTVIPESFSNIAGIAALGGQLDIAADGIDEFTEVTAKLTATTDLSADAAGTALGRFKALLGVPESQFNNLASSILKVGVNSVATETQIVSIATQISSMGNFAGLTADQVVGLAGALASTGTAPELARGTVTRLFTLMSQAVAGTTDKLDDFARVSGVSAEEFRKAWGTSEFADVFQKFLKGIGTDGREALEILKNIPEETLLAAESFEELGLEGNNAVQTLRDLGITSVRDVPALLRLADAGDVVGDAFSDAASGFREGTELNEQYAKIADTVASKLATIGNTIQAILANIADDGVLNVLGSVLDAVQNLANVFLAISRNPVGKAVMGVVTAFTALIGVYTAVKAAQFTLDASLMALVTAKNSLAAASNAAGMSMRRYAMGAIFAGGASRGAAGGVSMLTASLRGLLITTGIGIALVALGAVVEGLSRKMRSAEDAAQSFFGSSSSYIDALKQDTETLHETGEALSVVEVSYDESSKAATTSRKSIDEWTAAVPAAGTAADDVAESVGGAADEVDRFTVALGENFRAQMVQSLLASEEFTKVWENFGPQMEAAGFSLTEFFERALTEEGGGQAYMQNFIAVIKSQLNNLKPEYDELGNLTQEWLDKHEEYSDLADAFNTMNQVAKGLEATIHSATSIQDAYNKAMASGAEATQEGGNAAARAAQDWDEYSKKVLDVTDSLIGQINASVGVENALFSLGESIATNGLDFSQVTEAGRANLTSLMNTVNALVANTVANGGNAADAIAGLIQALEMLGVDAANDLVFLTKLVADLGGVTGMAGVQDATLDAVRAIEQGFGSVAPKSMKKASNAAKDVQKQVKTTLDYASELGSVFDDAFRFRFGQEEAKDATKDLWQKWKDDIRAAKDRAKELRLEIRAIKAEQASLTAQKSKLTYQLSIAQMFGDEARVQEILAEIGEVDSELANNKQDLKLATRELKDVQDELNAGLKGNSQAARDQRERIRELLESYQDQMEEAAANGASQKELRELAKKLKKEFEDQAEKIGLSKDELEKYSDAFDDMEEIVKKVPRDVTTKFKADASPAEKALAVWRAKIKKVPKKVNTEFNATTNVKSNLTGKKAAQQALAEALKAQRLAYKEQPGGGTRVDYWDSQVNKWRKLVDAYGFASGGFTGRGGKFDVAGTVHRGEFVFPKEYVNQSTGLPYANVLGSMAHAMGSMSSGNQSGNGIQLVELLPNQLDQLARAVSARVSIDGRVVASVSNGYNSAQYARGAG